MQLKTITAPNMNVAMDQIRKIYGDDAVIVSSQKDEESGGIRVTAAIEQSNSNEQFEELSLADLVTQPHSNPIDVVGEAFDKHSIPRRMGDHIIAELEALEIDDPVMALAGALEARYNFRPLSNPPPAKPIILVGPPGAGKTLLTAKLAARHRLQGEMVDVITTDVVKAGGKEQLESYTKAMKATLHTAEGPEELKKQMANCDPETVTIVDTTGINPFLDSDFKELEKYIEAAQAEPVLVLSGGGDAEEAGQIAKRFNKLGVARFVYTRLDMTRKYGSLLMIADRGELSFSDVSISPMVAEGFYPLTPVALARLFLEGS